MIVGVVSDTHGLVRDEAIRALAGSELVLHAGDVGAPAVLTAYAQVAKVMAVRGNVDRGAWARALPERLDIEIGGARVVMAHALAQLGPLEESVRIVVSGHSHTPSCTMRGGILFLNPGSAGPRRFSLPVAVARLEIGQRIRAHIVELDVAHATAR